MTGTLREDLLRLQGIRDFIFSSPVGAAGRVYVTGRDGRTVVLNAWSKGKDTEVIAVNRLDDSFSASAAVVGREIYLRGEKFLYCISEKDRDGS
jgi:hypothetical protein